MEFLVTIENDWKTPNFVSRNSVLNAPGFLNLSLRLN